jgi:hypothetical protein
MESPIINNPLFNLYFKMVNKFTPNFHRCPMKKHEEIMLRNFTIDFNLIPASFLVLNGHFRLEFTYFSTKFGDKVLYYESQIFASVLKRVPYKKRTKSGKKWWTIYQTIQFGEQFVSNFRFKYFFKKIIKRRIPKYRHTKHLS